MKRLIFGLAILMSIIFTACGSKDAEVTAFITDSDKLADEIVQKIKSNPTVQGVDEAQKILDGQKADLKLKYENLKAARGYQVKEETMKSFTQSVFKNVEAINKLRADYIEQTMEDQNLGKKIDQLVDDFNSIYEV